MLIGKKKKGCSPTGKRKCRPQYNVQVCVAPQGVSPYGRLMYVFKYSFRWGLTTAGFNCMKCLWVQGLISH